MAEMQWKLPVEGVIPYTCPFEKNLKEEGCTNTKYHTYNKHGVYLNPDIYEIKYPKSFGRSNHARIRVARTDQERYLSSLSYATKDSGFGGGVSRHLPNYRKEWKRWGYDKNNENHREYCEVEIISQYGHRWYPRLFINGRQNRDVWYNDIDWIKQEISRNRKETTFRVRENREEVNPFGSTYEAQGYSTLNGALESQISRVLETQLQAADNTFNSEAHRKSLKTGIRVVNAALDSVRNEMMRELANWVEKKA